MVFSDQLASLYRIPLPRVAVVRAFSLRRPKRSRALAPRRERVVAPKHKVDARTLLSRCHVDERGERNAAVGGVQLLTPQPTAGTASDRAPAPAAAVSAGRRRFVAGVASAGRPCGSGGSRPGATAWSRTDALLAERAKAGVTTDRPTRHATRPSELEERATPRLGAESDWRRVARLSSAACSSAQTQRARRRELRFMPLRPSKPSSELRQGSRHAEPPVMASCCRRARRSPTSDRVDVGPALMSPRAIRRCRRTSQRAPSLHARSGGVKLPKTSSARPRRLPTPPSPTASPPAPLPPHRPPPTPAGGKIVRSTEAPETPAAHRLHRAETAQLLPRRDGVAGAARHRTTFKHNPYLRRRHRHRRRRRRRLATAAVAAAAVSPRRRPPPSPPPPCAPAVAAGDALLRPDAASGDALLWARRPGASRR